jgi:predicted MFS family arabinose efflux permease
MAIASPIMGNLVDRFSPRLLLSSGLAVIGGGILLMAGATETWQLNLAYGVIVMGLSMGLLTAGHALGTAAGAKMGGTLFDLFASYQWTWIIALATALLAGILCFVIRENRDRGWLVPVAA